MISRSPLHINFSNFTDLVLQLEFVKPLDQILHVKAVGRPAGKCILEHGDHASYYSDFYYQTGKFVNGNWKEIKVKATKLTFAFITDKKRGVTQQTIIPKNHEHWPELDFQIKVSSGLVTLFYQLENYWKFQLCDSTLDSEKLIEIEDEKFEMVYYCSSNRYIFKHGVDQMRQVAEITSLVKFPEPTKDSAFILDRVVNWTDLRRTREQAYYSLYPDYKTGKVSWIFKIRWHILSL